MKKLILLTTTVLLLLLCSQVWATNYYVAQSGAGSYDGATIGNAWSVAHFNAGGNGGNTYAAGDTIEFDGTITTTLVPAIDGTSGNVITLSNYDAAAKVETSSGVGIDLTNLDYITLDDLTFYECADHCILMNTSTNITVQNSTIGDNDAGSWNSQIKIGHRDDGADCSTIKILDNTLQDCFNHAGAPDYATRITYGIYIGRAKDVLIEGNSIGTVGHTSIFIAQNSPNIDDVVIRDNDICNKWHYGISVMRDSSGNTLIENNRLFDMGLWSTFWTVPGGLTPMPYKVDFCKEDHPFYIETDNVIIRYNEVWDSESAAVLWSNYNGDGPQDCPVYHNTFYSNKEQGIVSWFSYEYEVSGNAFINNIFAETEQLDPDCCSNGLWREGEVDEYDCQPIYQGVTTEHPYEIAFALSHADADTWHDWWDYNIFTPGNTIYYWKDSTTENVTIGAAGWQTDLSTTFSSDWGTNNISVDPLFTDAASDDFSLTSSSQAIDAARYLTTISSVAGNVLTVVDAKYFYDGWGIAGETGDTIYDDDGNSTTISSIDYATNEITVADATGFTATDGITTVNYAGAAPDIGANEYAGAEQNTAPYVTVYSPGGDITIYNDVADTITANCTAVDDQSDTISYLWTLPNSDKNNSTLEDPGTVTFTWAGADTYSCSLKVTDEHGAYNTYSFTVIHSATQDDYSDITFWWRCEGTSLDANLDHSAGDTSATAVGTPALNAGAGKYGNGLDAPAATDYYEFDSANIVDGNDDRIGRWIRVPTYIDTTRILSVYEDANNMISLVLDAPDELQLLWYYNSGFEMYLTTTDANIPTGSGEEDWRYVEFAYDAGIGAGSDYAEIWVDGVSKASISNETLTPITPTKVQAGIITDHAADVHADNIAISNDKTRDLNDLSTATQYPGYSKIGSIGTTTQSRTYGISGSLSVPVMFVDGNGNPKTVTWTDAALPYGYLLTETGGTDLRLYHSSPATTVAASTHWFSTHATDGDYVNSMIAADMASADLTVSSIELEGGTFDADISIPAGENLDDNSAIVIDTDASAFHANSPYWCQSDGTQITANTEITTAGYYYIAIESDDATNYLFSAGPLGNPYLTVRMLPANRLAYYFTGIGTSKLILRVYLYAGDRSITAEDTEVIVTTFTNGATKLVDAGGNEFDYTLDHTWLIDANTLTVNIPYPSTDPKEFSSTSTLATAQAAGFYGISDDFLGVTEANAIGAVDMSASDGTDGHPITLDGGGLEHPGNQTFGKYWDITRIIHGSTVELGLGGTHKYSLIPVGDILKVPEGATGCTIHDDGIPGTLDLDE
ncbi:right-handed parallel beta-helix repeat-containing protein, partial [Candidatus Pacearchaeota archaeon]|nr:right-handed parallel beta-helix repeat-containing protein [Candidatus Pacearchaeota archaeon]